MRAEPMDTEDGVVMAREKGDWRLRGRAQRGGNGDIGHSVNNKNKQKGRKTKAIS